MLTNQIKGPILPERLSLKNASETNTNALVSIPVNSLGRVIIHGVQASYSATPTGGRLAISDGTNVFDIDIPTTFVEVTSLLSFAYGADVNAVLYAGGSTIVGKLNVEYIIESE